MFGHAFGGKAAQLGDRLIVRDQQQWLRQTKCTCW